MKVLAHVLSVLMFLVISASTATAQTTSSLSGTISATPEMNVVTITTPSCGVAAAFVVNYSARPFTVTASGDYELTGSASAPLNDSELGFYVYQNAFDPLDNTVNCIGATNNTPLVLPALALTAGTPYFLVAIDDTFTQPTETTPASYTVVFNGPGAVVAGGAAVTAVPTLSHVSLMLLALLLGFARPWRRGVRH